MLFQQAYEIYTAIKLMTVLFSKPVAVGKPFAITFCLLLIFALVRYDCTYSTFRLSFAGAGKLSCSV